LIYINDGKNEMQTAFKNSELRNYLFLFLGLFAIYAFLSFMTPASEATARYGLTYAQLNLVRISYLVPNLLIWLLAGMAVVRLHKYTKLVKGSPESKSFDQIAEGLLLLFLALIIPPFLSLLTAYDPGDQVIQKLVTIFRNYITIILYITSFWQLRQGSRALNQTIGLTTAAYDGARKAVYGLVAILGTAYIYTIYQNQFRTESADPLIRSTYFLPDWLILASIIAPYIMIWLLGLLAIVNFREFSKTVTGVVYKKAFNNTANGLIAIISLSVSLQFLSQLAGFFGRARLSVILGIIYIILLVMAIGYFFIARGVRALTAIEEY
jgi:hypothetical protein